MDILKAEIARKKKQLQDTEVVGPEKKYFKRGELAAKQEEEYWKKHKRLKEDDAIYQPSVSTKSDERDGKSHEERVQLPRKEVIKRLRERGEPIILFGESEYEAFQRLKKIEMLQPEINKGFKNDFKAAMDQVDQDYLNEMLKHGGEIDSKTNDVKVKDDGTTYEEIVKMSENLGKGDEALDCEVILKFLKLVLKKWGDDLNSRSPEDKRSSKGKLASATHSQTITYLKPFFRKLKRRSITADILSAMVDIVGHLIARNYIKANDSYLEMAIGNAPWPIGVTMVGIHARTGREKIFDKNVAHVLNDETQRKYLQGVKRLMTQCQKYFPTDPSRSVDYKRPELE